MADVPPSPPRAAKATGTAWRDETDPEKENASGGRPNVGRERERGFLARYCRWSHDRPCLVFTTVFLTVILMFAAVALGKLASFNTDAGDKEWIILNDPVTETADAAETALGLAARTADAAGSGAGLLRAKQSEGGSLLFHFESSVVGRSVFNEQTLLLMKEIDTIVMSVPGYTEVCQLAYDDNDVSTGCVPRVSPVLYFFPTIDAVTGNVTNDGNGEMVTDIDAVVRSFSANKRAFGYFLDSEFDDTSDGVNLFNKVTRVKYPMGAPRAGFVAADDEENKQRSEIGELWLDFVEQALFKRFAMKAEFLSTPYMGLVNEQNTDVRFYAGYLRSKDSQRIIGLDLSWAGASVLAVWAYMAFHTGSMFVASLGMFEILASFPVSIFLYRILFRVAYLGNIQILSIFVVLGVGADDVFVFFDAFKQSAYEPIEVSGTTLGRVTYTARRASGAIFVTSLTTAIAFAATAMSKVMPIAAFGALSATMIIVLFGLNVLFFPPALVFYERWVRTAELRKANGENRAWVFMTLCCGCGAGSKKQKISYGVSSGVVTSASDNNKVNGKATDADAPHGVQTFVQVQLNDDEADEPSIPRLSRQSKMESQMDLAKLRPIEWFYRNPFFRVVCHPVVKWFLVVVFTVLLVTGFYMASQLATPAEQEAWYPPQHLMQAFSNNRRRFMSSDEDRVVPVDFFWGLGGMDVRGVDKYDPVQRGELVLDTSFDASSPEAQTFLKQVCVDVKTSPCDAPGCGGAGSSLVRNGVAGKVVCPMQGFASWLAKHNQSFPVPENSFQTKLKEFIASDAGEAYAAHVGFDATDKLIFIRVSMKSTLVFPTVAKVARPVFDTWERFVSELNLKAPPGVHKATQTAYYTWTWMKTQEALVENTFSGLIICFVMAFFVLMFSTMDLRVGLISTVTIAGVVTTVMGVGVHGIMKWSLGIGESIAAVILIGLSVDYCVHLANAYVEAPLVCDTRELRTQHALMTMGISITASAITTIISGSMLWLCILTFFSKFAFLITATIVSSTAWSLFFLPAALSSIGPAGRYSWSSLRPARNWVVKNWREKRNGA